MSWIPKERSPAVWNRPSQDIRGWIDLDSSFVFWGGDLVADVRIVNGYPVLVTPEGKLMVDAQVSAQVADSKIKGSTDAGTTWIPVKVDAEGNLSVSLYGSITEVVQSGNDIIVTAGATYPGSRVFVGKYRYLSFGIIAGGSYLQSGVLSWYESAAGGTDYWTSVALPEIQTGDRISGILDVLGPYVSVKFTNKDTVDHIITYRLFGHS